MKFFVALAQGVWACIVFVSFFILAGAGLTIGALSAVAVLKRIYG